jgi:hypothetical protein
LLAVEQGLQPNPTDELAEAFAVDMRRVLALLQPAYRWVRDRERERRIVATRDRA